MPAILDDNPDMLLLTKHDSVLCTIDNLEIVESAFLSQFANFGYENAKLETKRYEDVF